jgi:hypothetical protein
MTPASTDVIKSGHPHGTSRKIRPGRNHCRHHRSSLCRVRDHWQRNGHYALLGSATGTLEIAARALGETPIAGSLRSMAKHLGMLRRAVDENDVETVAALFQVYRFD